MAMAAADANQRSIRKRLDVMIEPLKAVSLAAPRDPIEEPPGVPSPTPGQPQEPPREAPPGRPRPEIPPVIDDPAEPDQPDEFPPPQPDVVPTPTPQPPTLG